jgi:thioredoxin-dependent peroxiredoxin
MDVGDAIPEVTATGADGAPLPLRSLAFPAVVWFYPKDDTTGCTREAQDFTALASDFAAAGVSLLGVSRDDVKSHAKFTAKYGLVPPLASDLDGSVTEAFGVWVEKSMYGRTYMGIERSTFLFDRGGKLAQVWRKVRVPGHAQAVLDAAAAL